MGAAAIEEVIERLKAQIRGYRERRVRLSEADTLRVLITPMLKALGWAIYDVDEVRNEYRHNPSDNPVDYALFLSRTPVLFVEAKALGETLAERRWMVQTINYANTSGVEWCVLTNGNEYRFYKVHAQVQVEEKLFLSVVIDDDTPTRSKARKLGLISREQMGQRAIDELWTEWRVDRQVRAILEMLPSDDKFIRLIIGKSDGLGAADVRSSLRRATIRVDYPGIADGLGSDLLAMAGEGLEGEPPAQSLTVGSGRTPEAFTVGDHAENGAENERRTRARPMRTTEMFELGLIRAGLPLTIKGRPDSTAIVVDGRHVDYRGQRMSFNDWGCRATGWTAIQIYEWALLEDGRKLAELRSQE